jgi:nitrogen fixation NifU-like protein
MSGKEFDFWQDHSLRYLEMAFRADRCEVLCDPDGLGERTGDCGDTVRLFITMREDRIHRISVEVKGCLNTLACANAVAELAEGCRLDEAWRITPRVVRDFLETLPAGHEHCAELAVGALYLALSDCQRRCSAGTG